MDALIYRCSQNNRANQTDKDLFHYAINNNGCGQQQDPSNAVEANKHKICCTFLFHDQGMTPSLDPHLCLWFVSPLEQKAHLSLFYFVMLQNYKGHCNSFNSNVETQETL